MGRKTKVAIVLVGLLAGAACGYALFGPGRGEISLGQRVNAFIDDLQAAGVRMLDLPLFMLFAAAALFAGVGVVVVEKLAYGKIALKRTLTAGLCLALLGSLAIVADRRIGTLQQEKIKSQDDVSAARMGALNATEQPNAVAHTGAAPAPNDASAAKVSTITPPHITVSPTTAPATKKRDTFMYDRDAARAYLSNHFAAPDLRPVIYDKATDLVQMKSSSPLTVAYLSIIDLTVPGVEIKMHGDFTAKTLTSTFALANDCTIAINGEAGNAPQANTGLGPWTGHFVVDGKTVLSEQSGNPRPFLSFAQNSLATFTAQAAKTRLTPANGYNVIWGRSDAILNGEVQTEPQRNRQPRTAMGINKEGTKLYLLVVDGRQQRDSIGFSRAEVGHFLKAFGAYNGMLCDEGGSSTMYTSLSGIWNYPSDGVERGVYSHFGVVTPK